jgi:hypothetical protein
MLTSIPQGTFIAWCGLTTDYALLGGFRHAYYLATTHANIEQITYINYMIQGVTTFFYSPAKLAVGLLVLRIVAGHRMPLRKWLIYVSLAVQWIGTIINVAMTYVQCDPPASLWNPTIPHTCWDPEIEPHFADFTSG